ncbi:MAG: heme d1 biosynthesis radical SAM protein NirJ [Aquabacterium sp.]|nr:heme d1 biosynthesis radical SAM protein NirJ [Aquabacterium sp.]
MLRLSRYMRLLARAESLGRWPEGRTPPAPTGPVVIWNLTRRCNLTCKHCYALSADMHYPGELSTEEAKSTMADLKAAGVPALILSGGEPLLRPDIFELAAHARELGLGVSLSSNGTLIDAERADRIAAAGFDYVGVSIDGLRETHDKFRRLQGAFDATVAGLRLMTARGLKVGLRYTMTAMNAHDLPALLQLMRDEGATKFYFSHLNYAGRGNIHRAKDAHFQMTRDALDRILDRAWQAARDGLDEDYVTGNNDADGPYFIAWARRQLPQWAPHLEQRLRAWGGNASGLNVANIDNTGDVHPDTMWWHHRLGNVRERRFADIWADTSDPLMAGLKQQPRPVTGRCASCIHLGICGGNTRTRAHQLTGDFWAEDPGCYLTDEEIGLTEPAGERLTVTPFRSSKSTAVEARRAIPIVLA